MRLSRILFLYSILTFLFPQNTLSIENVNSGAGTLDIYMENTDAVGGFQFALLGIDVTGASGGSAQDAGFTISNSETTILGFSFTGATIPQGQGTLVSVSFDGFIDSICLDGLVMSSSEGTALDFEIGDCFSATFGCTDPSACNYNSNATEDDASCAYETDCSGECVGDAVIDDCGVCDGFNQDMDCTGLCNGDAEIDCSGICEGTAELDVCGVCNGGESDLNNCFENNTLTLSSASINAGESASIEIGLFNVDPVYGFQMDIQDWPNYGDFSSDVLATDRF